MGLLGGFFREGAGQGTPRERSISGSGTTRGPGLTGWNNGPPQSVDGGRVLYPRILLGSSFADWAEDFLFAGASALLLLCANLSPDYWFASFIALAPLLYRILKTEPGRAFRLGLMLGLSFFGVSLLNLSLIFPVLALGKIVCGTLLFAFFGWAVAWCRNRWGFNPLIVALLWVALELSVIRLGFPTGLLADGQASHPLFGGMAALFGFLSISFLIVLLNSLLIYALGVFAIPGTARGMSFSGGEKRWRILPCPRPIAARLFLIPEERGPPFRSA